jgi:hypothetical protein
MLFFAELVFGGLQRGFDLHLLQQYYGARAFVAQNKV